MAYFGKQYKTYRLSIILLSFVWLFTGGVVIAQEPIQAEVDKTTIALNDTLLLTVTINGNMTDIYSPDMYALTDFVIISSTSSNQISIINGQVISRGVFQYRLQPMREGSLFISPIAVEIKGETYYSLPINIEVTSKASGSIPSLPEITPESPNNLQNQSIFVEAEVDNYIPYIGQQFSYIFKFYQASNSPVTVFGQPDYQSPSFTNFWSQSVMPQTQYTTVINEQTYIVTEIRTALFPLNPGTLTIDSTKLLIPGNIFNPDVTLETKPINIEARSLPKDAPNDFYGAVGQFKINAQFKESKGRVNEPLTLIIEIEGSGNIEKLTEPALPELTDWRVFENIQSSTTTGIQNDMLYGLRSFERLVTPNRIGEVSFPPVSFSYYDPQLEAYKTINTDPVVINIKTSNTENPTSAINQPIDIIAGDIRHIKTVPTSFSTVNIQLLSNPLYWVFWFVPVIMVIVVAAWQKRRQRLFGDKSYMRRRQARRTAHRILAQADGTGNDSSIAHHALLGYLSDKLNRPTVGLTTDELINLLNEQNLKPELIEQIKQTIEKIVVSRFAPIEETAAQSLISEIKILINNLEKSFGERK